MGRPASGGLRRGFTLTELLVVIAIIALLLAILFVVGRPLQQSARRTTCLVNQHQIAIACSNYATDNGGRLPSPRTDKLSPEGGSGVVRNPWVNCTQSEGTLTYQGVELKGSLEKGVLWPYMNKNYAAYRSPLDPTNRVRSYSLSAFVGVGTLDPDPLNRHCDELYTWDPPNQPPKWDWDTQSMTKVPQPARTMMVMPEEDTPGYNRHGWVIQPDVAKWIDLPSFWDGTRINIAMMDGSTESLNILSPKISLAMDAYGNEYFEPAPSVTWRVMRQYLLPGKIK